MYFYDVIKSMFFLVFHSSLLSINQMSKKWRVKLVSSVSAAETNRMAPALDISYYVSSKDF